MVRMKSGEVVEDSEVRFFDGLLTILCSKPIGQGYYESWAYRRWVTIYDKEGDVSLKDILDKYPYVSMVIFETGLEGKIYKYGNHHDDKTGAKIWEWAGTTVGWA